MPFSFDSALGRYRDASGALVPEAAVRRALDQVLAGSAQNMRALTQMLVDGNLSLSGWQAGMMAEIKSAHLVGATLATGGWGQMTQSDLGWVGSARIKREYRYLRDFAAQISSGQQPLNGTVLARATMYAGAARQTHRAQQTRLAMQRGMEQERNQLGAADHCGGAGSCLGETARGWVPIGSLIPCGSRRCLSRCHCSLIYRTVPQAVAA